MSATDQHLDRARDALAEAGEARIAGSPDLAAFYLDAARVHAAIAAVEEQRTANLIAVFDEEGPEVFYEPRSDDKDERVRAIGRTKARWVSLAAEVAERLDLA